MQVYSTSSSTSYVRAPTTAHSMAYSTPSPPADEHAELGTISSPRRASHGDAPLDPSSAAAGVKYACAACIRGHRTSSCTHKDGSKGPLYPVRSKGRPPTQCEICRKKRKESGRHVRCDCSGKKPWTAAAASTPASHSGKKLAAARSNVPILPRIADEASSSESTDGSDDQRPSKKSRTQGASNATSLVRTISSDSPSDYTLPALNNVLAPIRPHRAPTSWSLPSIHAPRSAVRVQPSSESDEEATPRRHSTLSLSSLMNPCGCRSAGACTCCSDQRQRRAPVSPKQSGAAQDCDPARCACSGNSCLQRKRVADTAASVSATTSNGCSGKGASASAAPSIELLLRAVDMSTEFVPPACGCGENCRCSRCLAKQDATAVQQLTASNRASSRTASSASPRTPPATLLVAPTTAASAPGCDDCAACDLALERPSGIVAVDSWMEKQRVVQQRGMASSPPPQQRHRSSSAESGASRQSSDVQTAGVPTMHGGFVASGPQMADEMRAELVLVHPKCNACLDVVRSKGVGVLSSVGVGSK